MFPPPQQAGRLTSLLQQMLATDPSARPSMPEVATRLERLASGNGERLSPTPLVEPPTAVLTEPTLTWTQPAVASASPGPAGGSSGRARESRRGGRLLAAVAGLIIVVVLAGIGWWQFGRPGPLVAQNGESASPVVASSTDPTTDVTVSTASPTPLQATPSTSVERSSVPPTTNSPTASPTRGPSATSATDLAQAITTYYALMPRGTKQAWPRMTANYQTNHAGGWSAYQRFWNPVARVSVSGVTGLPPGRARATITYYYKNGKIVTERTAYGLVEAGGQLKISRSTVLSSGIRYT